VNNKIIAKTIEIAHALCPINRQNGLRAAHIAVLVKKNKIVKIGWNKNRTHPKTKEFPYVGSKEKYSRINVGIHAELDVILKSGKDDLSGYDLMVLRVDGTGRLNSSKPCIGCQSAIRQFGIKNIYFSNAKGLIDHECY
jgi:hypothetical protein